MKKLVPICLISLLFVGCFQSKQKTMEPNKERIVPLEKTVAPTDLALPSIGILLFEGVIMNEVVAPMDVFSCRNKTNEQLFNVFTIAIENKIFTSANGLKIMPDYTIDNLPKLDVLVLPSSYEPLQLTTNVKLVHFVQEQSKTTQYLASHCAGAFLLGEAGVADGLKIVTYVTGGKPLQTQYPKLKVEDDALVSFVQDGPVISSNGSLVSYLASFELLEKLTNKAHRNFAESSLLLDRLQNAPNK